MEKLNEAIAGEAGILLFDLIRSVSGRPEFGSFAVARQAIERGARAMTPRRSS